MPNLNRKFVAAIVLVILLLAGVSIARADVKVRSRQSAGGQTTESTTLIKGKRQRIESNNGSVITIQQCDLRRDLQIIPASQVYRITRYEPAEAPLKAGASGPTAPGMAAKGGVITTTLTSRDTGERKQMFGYTARRLITTIQTDSSPEACTQLHTKMETDGWYIDATFGYECDLSGNYNPGNSGDKSGCRDRYEVKEVGKVKRGYPVLEKTTMFGPNGEASFTMTNEVIEISQATLDASLFDAPAGYREVSDFSRMTAASGN